MDKFAKTVTYQRATSETSLDIARVCERACNYDNMLAHGLSRTVRVKKFGERSRRRRVDLPVEMKGLYPFSMGS